MRLTKKTAILLSVLLVLGVAISFIALIMCGFDFATFNIDKYEEKTYEIVDDFKNITINASTADIAFYTAEDGKCKVVCDESEKTAYKVGVQDGRVDIILNDGRKWYDNLRLLDFSDPKIAVYLTKVEYNTLKIETDTGDITLPKGFKFNDIVVNASTGDVSISADIKEDCAIKISTGDVYIKDIKINGNLAVTVSTGKTVLENVTCKNFTSSGNTGDVMLKNVIVAKKMNIERSTGDVKFVGSDAGEIYIKTSTGDVEGSLLTDKFFIVKTSTGNINVPETVSENKCRITTSTGNIIIKIG